MKLIILIMITSFFSACAVMDLSTLETAVPLGDEKINIAAYQGIGLDLSSAVISDYEESELDGVGDELYASADLATGLKLGIGVAPTLDLVGRTYFGFNSYGYKVGLKKQIWNQGDKYITVMPLLTYVKNFDYELEDEDGNSTDIQQEQYRSTGAELNLMYSTVGSKHVTFTSVARANINLYKEVYSDSSEDEYVLAHGGVRANVRFRLGPLYFMPEVGLELVPVKNGKLSMLPAISYAAGLQF